MTVGNQPPPDQKKITPETRSLLVETLNEFNQAGRSLNVTVDTSLEVVVAQNAALPRQTGVRRPQRKSTNTEDMSIDPPSGCEYRKKKLDYNQEFVFDRIYITKTGRPTLIFLPVDGREYRHIELSLQECDMVFPTFVEEVGREMKEKFGLELNTDTMKALYADLIAAVDRKQSAKAKREQEELFAVVAENPDWGAF